VRQRCCGTQTTPRLTSGPLPPALKIHLSVTSLMNTCRGSHQLSSLSPWSLQTWGYGIRCSRGRDLYMWDAHTLPALVDARVCDILLTPRDTHDLPPRLATALTELEQYAKAPSACHHLLTRGSYFWSPCSFSFSFSFQSLSVPLSTQYLQGHSSSLTMPPCPSSRLILHYATDHTSSLTMPSLRDHTLTMPSAPAHTAIPPPCSSGP